MSVPDLVFPVPVYDHNWDHLAKHAREPIIRDWFADTDCSSTAVNAAIRAAHERNLVITYDCLRNPTDTARVPTRLYLLEGGVRLFLVWRAGGWHFVTAFAVNRHPSDRERFDQMIRRDVQPLATVNVRGLIPIRRRHVPMNDQDWSNVQFDLCWEALEEWGYRRVTHPRFRLKR